MFKRFKSNKAEKSEGLVPEPQKCPEGAKMCPAKPLEHPTRAVTPPGLYGPRRAAVFNAYLPSLALYGAAGGLILIYMTDFKTLLQYLPYYNGKYKEE